VNSVQPKIVSIIIPCFNEQASIRLVLKAIDQQTYPTSAIEVIIVDGMSTDGTRQEIAGFQAEHSDLVIKIVDNPARFIPAGVNRGIAAASGKILIRLDGHAVPTREYVECCVRDLEAGRGDNVGGVWEIRPAKKGAIAAGIAAAASHPLGVGDARYRYAEQPQAVDTVPFFAFRRELLEKVGNFDESLLTNEDYEFNVRIRQSGGTVWLDPAIRSTYYARPTLGALARQYWRYGYWKGRMLLRYPQTLRLRQALPPAFTASLVCLAILAIALPWLRWLFAAEILAYSLVLMVVGASMAFKQHSPVMLFSLPLAIATMHLSWGTALWWSLIKFILAKK
jgi:glycosyltransferase involved in cell wall biosynthesis